MDIELDFERVKEKLEPSGETLPAGAVLTYNKATDTWGVRTSKPLSVGQLQSAHILLQNAQIGELKRTLVLKIDAKTQESLKRGFSSAALGSLHAYDLRLEDQINLSGALQAGLDAPIRCQGQDESFKSYKVHTKAQLEEVFSAGMAHKSKVLNFFGAQKAQVEAMQDYPSLLAFQIQELED
ncbi:hypothetical protein [Helicobacter felis]|uniref:DUF4376 domain-containing protein n=1 Tax=Helicobacter felis TaxID=214 RepID=UPI000EF6CF54|nr:hypothetical protein [Helicobacter felis]